jgi:hypothetical protein
VLNMAVSQVSRARANEAIKLFRFCARICTQATSHD